MSQRRGQARNSQRKLAEIRRQQRARQTRLRILAGAAVLAAVTLAVVAVIALTGGSTSSPRSSASTRSGSSSMCGDGR